VNGCQLPPGQDVGLETRRLDTTELKVLKKNWWAMPKEKRYALHLQKRNNTKSEIHRYLDGVIRFL
jgi:hypothetical protein